MIALEGNRPPPRSRVSLESEMAVKEAVLAALSWLQGAGWTGALVVGRERGEAGGCVELPGRLVEGLARGGWPRVAGARAGASAGLLAGLVGGLAEHGA